MNDKQLDDVIDRAVGEMMDVEPRAGFRQRVASRIIDIDAPPPRLFTLGRLAAVGTAAAVIVVVAAISFRPSDTVPRLASTEVAPAQPPVAQVPPAAIQPPVGGSSAEQVPNSSDVPRNIVVARSPTDSGPPPALTGVEPLVPPATLTVQQLETPAPQIQDIVVAPIAISELSVDPLDRSQR